MKLSVVIATYKRPKYLRNALESLCAQTADIQEYEVIVVDNNSKDETHAVVDEYKDKLNIRYILETNQGVSISRNTGVNASISDYIAFVDDDAMVTSDWVKTAISIIETKDPDVFGGPIYPYYIEAKPKWFKDEYEIRIHAKATNWMYSGHISGSNIVFKKQALFELGGFNMDLGPKGAELSYGEETALVEKARAKGLKIYYSFELIVKHLVPGYKMNPYYHIASAYIHGKQSEKMFFSSNKFSLLAMGELFSSLDNNFSELAKKIRGDNVEEDFTIENYIIEEIAPQMRVLGLLSTEFSRKSLLCQISFKIETMISGLKKLAKKVVLRR